MAAVQENKKRPVAAFLATQFDEAYQHAVWLGAEQEAVERNIALVFYEVSDTEGGGTGDRESIALSLVDKHSIDALIVMSNSMGNALSGPRIADLLYHFEGLPRASIGIEVPAVASVCAENAGGIKTLTTHLFREHGRRHFLFLAGQKGHPEGEARKAEFLSTLEELASEGQPKIIHCDFSEERAFQRVTKILASGDWHYDGVVAANDQMALGAIRALSEGGFSVPRDVSVTGYDNIQDAPYSVPPLTTVHQPAAELGRRAVRCVADALGVSHRPQVWDAKEMPSDLSAICVFRESCGCLGGFESGLSKQDMEQRLRYQVSLRTAAENRIRMLRKIESSLIASFGIEGILKEVAKGSRQLGIRYCALMIFDSPSSGMDWSRLLLLADEKTTRVLAPYGFRFRTSELIPGGLHRQGGAFVCEPLHFDGERLGYLVCSADSPDRHVYAALRDQVSTALKGALLMEAERDRERALELEVHRRTAELSFANRQLQDEIEQRKVLEREILDISNHLMARIGRDIHDDLCQDIAGIGVMAATLGGALRRTGVEGADMAGRISSAAGQTALHAKQIARELYPAELEANGIIGALTRLVESRRMEDGPELVLDIHRDFFVRSPEKALHLYRMVQEALNNAIRHSQATRITVGLYIDREMVTAEVSDNGRGMAEDQGEDVGAEGGMGLRILKYRANVIGGRLKIKSDQNGTLISCRVAR